MYKFIFFHRTFICKNFTHAGLRPPSPERGFWCLETETGQATYPVVPGGQLGCIKQGGNCIQQRLLAGAHVGHWRRAIGISQNRLAGAIADNPPVEHPVIRTHPRTGKLSIYVNALFTTRIRGLARAESDAILKFLYRHIITEEYTVRLRWAPGMIAMWDNAATQHRPVNDFFPQHRKMHRITIAGSQPQ